ncbi:MAG TPA: hypothetical protein VGE97_00390 [Nitrososphaera sp.]
MSTEEWYLRKLESELSRVFTRMEHHQVHDEEYAKLVSMAERLHSMLPEEKKPSVSRETLVTVGANLLGILMIIQHEHVNVITSKALGFVIRTR